VTDQRDAADAAARAERAEAKVPPVVRAGNRGLEK